MSSRASGAEKVGVLLMAYGGPDSLEDVPAYLNDVRGGRPYSDELLAELTERYRAIGGRSPILGITQAQAKGVARALNSGNTGQQFQAFVGMRHWHPYIREVVPDILAGGVDRLVAVVMAPHYSRMSVGAYLQRLDEALNEQAPRRELPVLAVESWKDQPAFIEAVKRRVIAGLEQFPEAERDAVMILYTAHSLPQRILEWGDRYPEELRESAESIAAAVGHPRWQFAFQSAGATSEPWLGPPIENVLEDLASEGVKNVLVCPIGFVCDHVEVLYDVDIEHRGQAEALGMRLERTASLNDDPLLCQAVATAVRERLTQSQLV
ncbi:MAG TPA: ferrochelatase [Thermomicrobiaceae bacterium]|nr:ferrochelatase [Thermomicrobiaceae bacterium]